MAPLNPTEARSRSRQGRWEFGIGSRELRGAWTATPVGRGISHRSEVLGVSVGTDERRRHDSAGSVARVAPRLPAQDRASPDIARADTPGNQLTRLRGLRGLRGRVAPRLPAQGPRIT